MGQYVGSGSRLHTPPRFNGVVKAVENKNRGKTYTKIGNLDTISGKGRVMVLVEMEIALIISKISS